MQAWSQIIKFHAAMLRAHRQLGETVIQLCTALYVRMYEKILKLTLVKQPAITQ